MRGIWYQIKIVLVFFILSRVKYIEEKDVRSLLNVILMKSDRKYRMVEKEKLDNLWTECYNIVIDYRSNDGNSIDSFYHGQAVMAQNVIQMLK